MEEIGKAQEHTRGDLTERQRIDLKGWQISQPTLMEVDQIMTEIWEESEKTLWDMNMVFYAGAKTVKRLVKGDDPKHHKDGTCQIREILKRKQQKVEKVRKVLGKLTAEWGRREKRSKVTQKLKRNIKVLRLQEVTNNGLKAKIKKTQELLEIRKAQLDSTRKRLKFREANERYRKHGVSCISAKRQEGTSQHSPAPMGEFTKFWDSIMGVMGDYDPQDPMLTEWTQQFEECERPPSPKFDQAIWEKVTRKCKNWRAPGKDGIQGFWLKAFPNMRRLLGIIVWKTMKHPRKMIEPWLVEGRTVLIPKENCTGLPQQYRPITCLNVMYKLLTASMTEILYKHAKEVGAIPYEQRALVRKKRGCLDALHIDAMIAQKSMIERGCMSVGWIDFQKAYDRVPHQWLKDMLEAVKAPRNVVRTVRQVMGMWRTNFMISGKPEQTFELQLRRGVFQGDSLSPLLFCLAIAPISYALERTAGIKCNGLIRPLTHLFFVDDLKIYAAGEGSLKRAMEVMDKSSRATGMALGLQKCGVAHMRKGRLESHGEEEIKGTGVIPEVTENTMYRYLGVDQVFRANHKTTRAKITKKYLARMRTIWSSPLSAKRKVQATNAWAVSTFRYYLTVIDWPRTELRAIDRRARKIIAQYQGHHKCASIERLYLPREKGGRGLQMIEQVWEREQLSMVAYLGGTRDTMLQAVLKHWVDKCKVESKNPLAASRLILIHYGIDMPRTDEEVNGLKKVVIKRQTEMLTEALRGKAIHGAHRQTIEESGIDQNSSFAWLKDGRVKAATEALIIAAQDGAIVTRKYQSEVWEIPMEPICRKCGDGVETIGHILSACEQSKWTLYKTRHDNVQGEMVKAIASKWKMVEMIANNKSGVFEGADGTLWVDTIIPTDEQIEARRPDIIIQNNASKTIWIADVACPWDPLVLDREREKINKYRPLAADLSRRKPQWKVGNVAIVVGTLGTVGSLSRQLAQIGLWDKDEIPRVVSNLQYQVIKSGVRIIRRHLSEPGH